MRSILGKLLKCRIIKPTFFMFTYPLVGFSQPEIIAIQLLDINNHTNPVVNIINTRIDWLWHTGKYEKIFPLFYLISRIDPEDEENWATGGWFLINCIAPTKKGDEVRLTKLKGVDFLKEGLTYNIESYRLYWEIAWVYYLWGDYEKALKYLDSAIKYEHPSYVENTRAHTLEKLGRIDDAIKQWKQIRIKFPEMRFVAERFIQNLEREKADAQ
ncbi:MAG: CDC27 family protein [bacterium]|nr:CDC27 family protein [bacterium]